MHRTEGRLIPAEIELKLLAALCSPVVDHETRGKILGRLARHKFANPDYETISRALNQIPGASTEHIRETLSARVTRLGFPDIDVEPIFAIEPPSIDEIQTLLRRLEA
jgi:hypothetical protein